MAEAADTREQWDAAGLSALLTAGLDKLRGQTPAEVGDKTMLDALVPAVEAFCLAARSGSSPRDAMAAAAQSAAEGAEEHEGIAGSIRPGEKPGAPHHRARRSRCHFHLLTIGGLPRRPNGGSAVGSALRGVPVVGWDKAAVAVAGPPGTRTAGRRCLRELVPPYSPSRASRNRANLQDNNTTTQPSETPIMPEAIGNLDAKDYGIGIPQTNRRLLSEGRGPSRLGHEGSAGPHLQSPQRANRNARLRPRLHHGPDAPAWSGWTSRSCR